MASVIASQLQNTRNALLAYAARYGVTDLADRRQLVARLWRAIPRHLNAAEAVVATDRLLSDWASQRLGFPISAAQLRLAVLETGADARNLLGEDVTGFIAAISPALLQPVPHETLVDMPVQVLVRSAAVKAVQPAVAAARAA